MLEKQRLARENHSLIDENTSLIGKIERLVDIFGTRLEQGKRLSVSEQSSPFSFLTGMMRKKSLTTPGSGNKTRNVESTEGNREKEDEMYAKKRVLLNTLDFARKKHIDKSVSDLIFADEEAPHTDVSNSPNTYAGMNERISAIEEVTIIVPDGSSTRESFASLKRESPKSLTNAGIKPKKSQRAADNSPKEVKKEVEPIKAAVTAMKIGDRKGGPKDAK